MDANKYQCDCVRRLRYCPNPNSPACVAVRVDRAAINKLIKKQGSSAGSLPGSGDAVPDNGD